MYMDSDGPKYRPEDPNELDRKKQHPKISEKYGKNPEWVRFRECR